MKPPPITIADVPVLVALLNEATPETPVDEDGVRSWFSNPNHDIAGNFRLFDGPGGRPLAYADLLALSERTDVAFADVRIPAGQVTGDVVGGVFGWADQRSLELGRSCVRLSSVSSDDLLGPQLVARGYTIIRHFFQMFAELGEERAVYEAVEDSFADHWDHVRGTYDEWAGVLMDRSFEPAVWFLAVDGRDNVGFSLCRDRQPGQPDTGRVRQLGRTSVGLGVDAENTTGAVRLYEKAGVHVRHRFDTDERRLT